MESILSGEFLQILTHFYTFRSKNVGNISSGI